MNAPAHIGAAARQRIEEQKAQIERSLAAIAVGRPGDAEPEATRRSAVAQSRLGMSKLQADAQAPRLGAEKIWGKTVDFVDVAFLMRGAYAARAVARVVTADGQGLGTGFMISPTLFLTNNHVIGSPQEAEQLSVEFDYERDLSGRMRPTTRFSFSPKTCFVTNREDDLDYTVVSVGASVSGKSRLSEFSFLPLSAARDKHQLGDHVNIIQHPDGRPKEAVVRENQLVSRAKTTLHYIADTEPGSSGSPVFNVLWQVVALHHWGSPHRDVIDDAGKKIVKTVNEGIRISAIVTDLNTRRSSMSEAERRLITEVIEAGLNPLIVSSTSEFQASTQTESTPITGVNVSSDGTATWTIPLRVSVQLGSSQAHAAGQAGLTSSPPATSASDAQSDSASAGGEAKVEIDENYANRGGYQPGFLSGYSIPLPKLKAKIRPLAAISREPKAGREKYELTYEHFSVVMNGTRKLAFFTATNIDGLKAKNYDRAKGTITAFQIAKDEESGAEASETWFLDRRIGEDEQTPPSFYSGQTAFDSAGVAVADKRKAAHVNRIFQQGHLTRRQDPLWGSDETIIRANADTFHVTNRSPQVGFFNMGVGKINSEGKHPGGTLHWRALEDYALNNAVIDKKRVIVFTGPIFDGDNDIPWNRGIEGMEGFLAPREYWKIVVMVEDGELKATAFCADQTPLIDYVPEAALSEAAISRVAFDKVERYRTSIAELESRTLIDFGAQIRAADTFAGSERRVARTLADLLTPSRFEARRRRPSRTN